MSEAKAKAPKIAEAPAPVEDQAPPAPVKPPTEMQVMKRIEILLDKLPSVKAQMRVISYLHEKVQEQLAT